ncbi:hypothetical protein PC110_g734 [Phytophthora cactorum]|nr:hypothetical protein PC112_g13719 [Phytophthora cactorum]KAG2853560.1 hypothetical protein PC113_g14074 [Phytophthora cactorum]KAG2911171.1 hypothetical protein PC115_g12644 [Phytophthora cactorum]KAG3155909.1 hypothetical protein PI126_g8993 [Phytophthora idaei]RAW43016.1 hypothetical protein PC110_g734 [Phytophthora cactorum]
MENALEFTGASAAKAWLYDREEEGGNNRERKSHPNFDAKLPADGRAQ